MIILRRWRMAKNLVDVTNDGVASSPQFMNEFEFHPWFLMVSSRSVLGRVVTDEPKRFTQEGNSLANDVTMERTFLM